MKKEIKEQKTLRIIKTIVGIIVRGGDGKPDRILEKHILKKDGSKEITFISEERKKDFSKKELEKYLNHFEIIEGKSKEKYLKVHNLKVLDRDIKNK